MSTSQAEGLVPQWTVGDRLAKALRVAGVSNGDMAEYLGVSRNTIGNYIADRTDADKRTRMLWALRTGVRQRWIETGEGEVTGPEPTRGDAVRQLAASKRGRSRGASTGLVTREYDMVA